jgi:ribonuclease HII
MPLKSCYNDNENVIEIGVDEVGRGPMFGRVYCAAVILPKNNFKHELMKDSKKFHSKKKIEETAQYIKENCTEYSIAFEDEKCIDKENIKNATHIAMHKAIKNLITKLKKENITKNQEYMILVDGRDFKPLTYFDNDKEIICEVPSVCIEGGDNLYTPIAAASILAKVERDNYIYDLCKQYPKLDEYYDLSKNKGYGTAKHMDGIREYGISQWHRTSFGLCKNSKLIIID